MAKTFWPLRVIIGINVALILFQLALILGVPWGHAAWGGQYRVLPNNLRVSSAMSLLVYGFVIWTFRRRVQQPTAKFPRAMAWIFSGYFLLGVIMNLASSSRWENFLRAPVALVLSISGFLVARSKSSSLT